MNMRSALGSLQPTRMDKELIKRDAWREDRILVVALNDPRLDTIDKGLIERLGEHLYGKRGYSR